jgi:hypothetical protein
MHLFNLNMEADGRTNWSCSIEDVKKHIGNVETTEQKFL